MRGKRSKQYRKLVAQYQMSFGFREPYQVLVDAEIIKDCHRQKMDLVNGLQRTLHAKEIKPMITQCCMRHLYAAKNEPGMAAVITHAQNDFLRAFCGHHPDKHPEPLSAVECIGSLVDGKDTGRNAKHYIVATQDQDVRRLMRSIKGVPLIFERRGVIIMEPMADVSVQEKLREERIKFRTGLRKQEKGPIAGEKRKRGDDEEEDGDVLMHDADDNDEEVADERKSAAEKKADEKKKKYKKAYGRKQPNPLSVKKSKKPVATVAPKSKTVAKLAAGKTKVSSAEKTPKGEGDADKKKKRKRRKTATATSSSGDAAPGNATSVPAAPSGEA
ncbi:rRNA-processing protein utp23 [Ceratocystis lukuohia]|uniref:rRNA-processing protein utp23 n=1 Tax=Ceratocystis lukuohia TaxID=2019550 RepID=A0ABR4MEQ5_9PEZI